MAEVMGVLDNSIQLAVAPLLSPTRKIISLSTKTEAWLKSASSRCALYATCCILATVPD